MFVHEFAHQFAALGDEYVGNVTYDTRRPPESEPWEPNLTLLANPAELKWRALVEPGTPLPTPDVEAGRVGAFAGGGYHSRGIYRPEYECLMGSTRPGLGFCRVCRRALEAIIDLDVE